MVAHRPTRRAVALVCAFHRKNGSSKQGQARNGRNPGQRRLLARPPVRQLRYKYLKETERQKPDSRKRPDKRLGRAQPLHEQGQHGVAINKGHADREKGDIQQQGAKIPARKRGFRLPIKNRRTHIEIRRHA